MNQIDAASVCRTEAGNSLRVTAENGLHTVPVNDEFERLEAIANMMKEGTPLVIYMGLINLETIIQRLMALPYD